jgi:hypothetical protein
MINSWKNHEILKSNISPLNGTQCNGHDFHAYWLEFEYGTTAWWTTELYLDAQTTFHDSTVATGFRGRTAFDL